MVRKLEQNFIWAHVLNPIVKDLKYIMYCKINEDDNYFKIHHINNINYSLNNKIYVFNIN